MIHIATMEGEDDCMYELNNSAYYFTLFNPTEAELNGILSEKNISHLTTQSVTSAMETSQLQAFMILKAPLKIPDIRKTMPSFKRCNLMPVDPRLNFYAAFEKTQNDDVYTRRPQPMRRELDHYHKRLVETWQKHVHTVLHGWEKKLMEMLDTQPTLQLLCVIVSPDECLDNITSFIESMRAGVFIEGTPISQDDIMSAYDGQRYVAVLADEMEFLHYSILCKLTLVSSHFVAFMTGEPKDAQPRDGRR